MPLLLRWRQCALLSCRCPGNPRRRGHSCTLPTSGTSPVAVCNLGGRTRESSGLDASRPNEDLLFLLLVHLLPRSRIGSVSLPPSSPSAPRESQLLLHSCLRGTGTWGITSSEVIFFSELFLVLQFLFSDRTGSPLAPVLFGLLSVPQTAS